MHIDLEQQKPQTFRSTLCIIGGGIAGILLASRFDKLGIQVNLLEAGGFELEEQSQALYQTEQPANRHLGAHEGRFRIFGGSSTRWGGQLLPYTPDIFDPLPGMPTPAWPVKSADLTRYFEQVQSVFQTDLYPFDESLLPKLGYKTPGFSSAVRLRYSKWSPFARRNLAQTLGKALLASQNVTVFTHANVLSVECAASEAGHLRAVNYSGNEFRFEAQYFIVAAGTIESSRVLLCSASVPNPHDQIGRYFHDHLSFPAAELNSPTRERIMEKLGPFFIQNTLHTCKMEASAETRAQNGWCAVMGHLVIEEPEDSGAAAIRNMLRSLQAGKLKQAVVQNFFPALGGIGDIARLLYAVRFKRRRAVSRRAKVKLQIDTEQVPNPDNRIRLSENRDALGLPVAVVDWRINEEETRAASAFIPLLAKELEDAGMAPANWESTLPEMVDTYHPMGGLRMGTDPQHSVVDADLKLHSLSNVYVASCAVFPSGGSSNPTFTMMALALRLADHLAAKLASKPRA